MKNTLVYVVLTQPLSQPLTDKGFPVYEFYMVYTDQDRAEGMAAALRGLNHYADVMVTSSPLH